MDGPTHIEELSPEAVEFFSEPVGVPIWEVPRNGCMFAVTPDDVQTWEHLFCGDQCEPGHSYCNDHRKVAYRPKEERRRGGRDDE